jgi:hypothetical protein
MARSRGRVPLGRRHQPHDQECLFFSLSTLGLFFAITHSFILCSDAEVRANALKSFLLNGISLLSIYVFDLLLHPLSKGEEGGSGGQVIRPPNGVRQSVGWFYRVLWLLPVVGVSFYLNVRDAFQFLHDRTNSSLPPPSLSLFQARILTDARGNHC